MACCCCSGCCCIDGVASQSPSQEACEEAGGAWFCTTDCASVECPSCPCGFEQDEDGNCVTCIKGLSIEVEWKDINIPRDDEDTWSIGGDGEPVHVLSIANIPGFYSHVPGGFIVEGGQCKFVGSVGTISIPNTFDNSGDCRFAVISWKYTIVFPSCDAMIPGTHEAQVEFFSGVNWYWSPAVPDIVAMGGAGDACYAISAPTVTLTFA